MQFTHEIEQMCCVKKGCNHGPAPIPQEGNWTQSREITDISGLTHGVGWCAPQQGTCKLTLNVKNGIIEEALVETSGCSGMTHSAAMAAEILPGKTVLEAMNTDLVCDAINTAMRELFLQIAAGGSIPNLSIPASNDWKSITFDLTAGKAQVLQNFPNAGKKGDRLRFDINNINGTPLYIRAIRLHKK